MNTRMVADVGGTNTRIALYDPKTDQFLGLKTYINRDYPEFEQIIESWLGSQKEDRPTHGCIAVAAAPSNDLVTMLNMDWSFSCSQLASRCGFTSFKWVNDFAAIAHALSHLKPQDRHLLHPGQQHQHQKWAAVGPGTGLGGATLEIADGGTHVGAAEPGYTGLSPGSKLELELFELLLSSYPTIYAELLISGPGLQRLYTALGEIHGGKVLTMSPSEIAVAAQEGTDECCVLALQTFCALLGSACGDFVLSSGAYGGLYLAGGIIPKMIDFLNESEFHSRFCQKGGMSRHLTDVPVYVITAQQPGLIGAAHVPL
ncbi:MAG: glucokinase [Halioglobus sp.]|jgi:glucokinase